MCTVYDCVNLDLLHTCPESLIFCELYLVKNVNDLCTHAHYACLCMHTLFTDPCMYLILLLTLTSLIMLIIIVTVELFITYPITVNDIEMLSYLFMNNGEYAHLVCTQQCTITLIANTCSGLLHSRLTQSYT